MKSELSELALSLHWAWHWYLYAMGFGACPADYKESVGFVFCPVTAPSHTHREALSIAVRHVAAASAFYGHPFGECPDGASAGPTDVALWIVILAARYGVLLPERDGLCRAYSTEVEPRKLYADGVDRLRSLPERLNASAGFSSIVPVAPAAPPPAVVSIAPEYTGPMGKVIIVAERYHELTEARCAHDAARGAFNTALAAAADVPYQAALDYQAAKRGWNSALSAWQEAVAELTTAPEVEASLRLARCASTIRTPLETELAEYLQAWEDLRSERGEA